MRRVTMGHLRITIGHLRVTVGHPRLIFSISKHKAYTTELHPKVRQTCYVLETFICKCGVVKWQHRCEPTPVVGNICINNH